MEKTMDKAKKVIVLLLACMLVLSCFGNKPSRAVIDPEMFRDNATVPYTLVIPFKFKKNQESSSNWDSRVSFRLVSSSYKEHNGSDTPVSREAVPVNFIPEVTIEPIDLYADSADVIAASYGAFAHIPAYELSGVYTYTFFVDALNNTQIVPDQDTIELCVTIYYDDNDELKRSFSLYYLSDAPVINPDDETPVLQRTKIDGLGALYSGMEFTVENRVNGSFADRDKTFNYTVKLEGAWYSAWYYEEKEVRPFTVMENDFPKSVITYGKVGSPQGTTIELAKELKTDVQHTHVELFDESRGFVNNDFHSSTIWTFTFEKTISFTLRHGEALKFVNLPMGMEVTVTQEDYGTEGYVTTIGNDETLQKTVRMWPEESYLDENDELQVQYGNEHVLFVNTLDGEVDTGVALDSVPYLVTIAAVAAGFVLLVVFRRKRGNA